MPDPRGPGAAPVLLRRDGSAADARALRLVVLDVDGILTDGTLSLDEDGRMAKRVAITDGAGIKLLYRAGLKAAIVSGHAFDGLTARFHRLGVEDVQVGVERKKVALEEILVRHGLARAQVLAMGDDVMDLPLMEGAGFAATVPGAHPRVLARADYVTARAGGHGAVREVVELLLAARGDLDRVLDEAAS